MSDGLENQLGELHQRVVRGELQIRPTSHISLLAFWNGERVIAFVETSRLFTVTQEADVIAIPSIGAVHTAFESERIRGDDATSYYETLHLARRQRGPAIEDI